MKVNGYTVIVTMMLAMLVLIAVTEMCELLYERNFGDNAFVVGILIAA